MPNLMNAHLVKRIRCRMESTAKSEPARESVPVTATVSMTANFACATVLADSLASGQKKNVPNFQILLMVR